MKVTSRLKRALFPSFYRLKDQRREWRKERKELRSRLRELNTAPRQLAQRAQVTSWTLSYKKLVKSWTDGPFYTYSGFGWILDGVERYTRRLPRDIPTIASRRKLILFARSATSHFFDPVAAALRGDFEIYYCPYLAMEALEDLSSQDVIWLEWGTAAPLLEVLAETPAAVVIRLHDWEIREADLIKCGSWKNADRIVFINECARRDFLTGADPELRPKSALLFNAVDERQFPLKFGAGRYSILIVCIKLSERKGIFRALDILRALVDRDRNFTLTIRTSIHDSVDLVDPVYRRVRELDLCDHVTFSFEGGTIQNREQRRNHVFELNIKVGLLAEYARHDLVWSTSFHEGFHYVVAEAALCGLEPVVIDWDWGGPEQFWAPFLARTADDFVEANLRWAALSEKQRRERQARNRAYVIERFGLAATRRRCLELLDAAENPPAPRRPRLIVFAHNHLYANNPRGGEKSTAAIVSDLIAKGYDCLVLVADRRKGAQERSTYEGVPVITVDGAHLRAYAIEIMRWWQPDVAIVWELPARDIWDICVSWSCPYVLFIRFWHLVAPPPYTSLLTQEIDEEFNQRHKPVFEFASEVIANCKHAATVIDRYYQVAATTAYVPVELSSKAASDPADRRYVTLINPKKTMGAEDLVYLLAESMPDLEFLVLQGDESRARSRNVTHRPYSNADYGEFLADTKLLLFPFKEEPCGTGRVVFECYSLAIPVLGSNRGGLPEVIPADYLLDDTDDIVGWQNAIRRVFGNYESAMQAAQDAFACYNLAAELAVVSDAVSRAIASGSVMHRVYDNPPRVKDVRLRVANP